MPAADGQRYRRGEAGLTWSTIPRPTDSTGQPLVERGRDGDAARLRAVLRTTRSAPPGWSTTAGWSSGCNVENAAYGVGAVRRVRHGLASCTLTGGGRLTHVVCVDGDGDGDHAVRALPAAAVRERRARPAAADRAPACGRMDEVLPDAFGPDDLDVDLTARRRSSPTPTRSSPRSAGAHPVAWHEPSGDVPDLRPRRAPARCCATGGSAGSGATGSRPTGSSRSTCCTATR